MEKGMPVYEGAIPNLESTVSKPMAIQALHHIRKNFFPDETVTISLIDQTGAAIEFGSTRNSDNNLLLDTQSLIQARYVELPIEDVILTTVADTPEMLPIWYDGDLNAFIQPIKAQTTVSLTITYQGNTKAQVDAWLGYLYTKFSRGSSVLPMSLRYQVCVPEGCLYIIKALHEAREANEPYGDIFPNYLDEHLLFPHDYMTNYLGRGTTLVLREELKNVVARLEPTVPEPTRGDNNTYTADVTFTYRYDKPISMTMNYPIFVHNGYINPDYFDSTVNRNDDMKLQNKSDYGLINNLSYLYDQSSYAVTATHGYIVPTFDPWKPPLDDRAVAPITQIQVAISADNPRLILDLNTIAVETGIKLHKDMIKYIINSKDHSFIYGNSAVQISVWRNNKRLNPAKYHINMVGQIISDYDMNGRGNYHITIDVLKDLGLLGDSGIKSLAKYGELTRSIIATANPDMPSEDYPPLMNTDPLLPSVNSRALRNVIENTLAYHRHGYPRSEQFVINNLVIYTA